MTVLSGFSGMIFQYRLVKLSQQYLEIDRYINIMSFQNDNQNAFLGNHELVIETYFSKTFLTSQSSNKIIGFNSDALGIQIPDNISASKVK